MNDQEGHKQSPDHEMTLLAGEGASKLGKHRRVKSGDLMAYREKIQQKSVEAMDELARIAQENDMGYG